MHKFIAYLCSDELKPHVNALKKATTKKKPIGFERLSWVLLPLVKYCEVSQSKSEAEVKQIQDSIKLWISMVENHPTINLSAKFEA